MCAGSLIADTSALYLQPLTSQGLPPSLIVNAMLSAHQQSNGPCFIMQELPSVEKLLSTMRARLEALNGPDVPRIHTDPT
jgi:hypothetical protein